MIKPPTPFSTSDVITALENERALARVNDTVFEVTAKEVVNEKTQLTIRFVRGDTNPEDIDALDGLQVKWLGMPLGPHPKVAVIDAGSHAITLQGRFKGPYPEVGTVIRTIDRDFFGPVLELWRRNDLGEVFLAQLERFTDESVIEALRLISHDLSRSLFVEQAAALGIVNYSTSFIWGTGGAGKTKTLATLCRAYMAMHRGARILVCTTSNKGVDELVLRIAADCHGAFRLKRYGLGYSKSAYFKYPDLLPDSDDELLTNQHRPYPFDELDPDIPAGIYAFTVVGVLSRFDKLAEHDWDLIIADEASQISLSHVLPVMSLGKKVVFVGDPEQCSPVAKTKDEAALSIVGTSAFAYMPPQQSNRMVMLNRQARMPSIVSSWAGKEFYEDKLTLAREVAGSEAWQTFRKRPFGRFAEDQHFGVINIPPSACTNGNRCIRQASARLTVELILEDDHRQFEWSEIAYITPFNGQANLVRHMLREAGLHSVLSSTSHKVQGAQFPVVILDPVFASGPFMRSAIGRQILNVGATRTQCKLIWLVSEDDLTNPWLTRLREFSLRPNQLLGL